VQTENRCTGVYPLGRQISPECADRMKLIVSAQLPLSYAGVVQPVKTDKTVEDNALLFNEIQLILAEKRTALSSLRTGISVFVLPLSVLSALIATSRYYDVTHVARLLVPLLVLNGALIVLGSYLIIHSIQRLHRYDRLIREIKRKHSLVADFID